ncbi:hypothetical protein V4F39_11985 [Aquincola sp. MAHUQ-54]|uniref:Uncharacterized protein n=1 Tax=Aquincola agrisoli TaxID=3119538 RepID=A0AAW9QB28_9BURK
MRSRWLAGAGGAAAGLLLWTFYGVVDGAVDRAQARAEQAPFAAAVQAEASGGEEGLQRAHAVYTLPASAEPLHYTRWP